MALNEISQLWPTLPQDGSTRVGPNANVIVWMVMTSEGDTSSVPVAFQGINRAPCVCRAA